MSHIEAMRAMVHAIDTATHWEDLRAATERLRAAITQAEQQADQEQVLELAEALERRRILEAIKAVAAIHKPDDMPTPYQSAWQGACEEIFYRATECQWHMDEDATRFARGAGEV